MMADSRLSARPAMPSGRRTALRFLAGGALTVVGAISGESARAGRTWCRRDPVISIDGQVVDILVSSYLEMDQAATGPTEIVVTVPRGVAAKLYAVDLGFGGHGYDVRFAEFAESRQRTIDFKLKVAVYVPATDGSLPVKVTVAPRGPGLVDAGAGTGKANAWVVVATP